MFSCFQHFSVFDDENAVGILNRGQSMRDDDRRSSLLSQSRWGRRGRRESKEGEEEDGGGGSPNELGMFI